MAKKYFASKDAEFCHELDHHLDELRMDGGGEHTLYLARPIPTKDFFWCHAHQECGESRQGCGRECDHYAPRNGKSGRCRHHGHCYENTDETLVIRCERSVVEKES